MHYYLVLCALQRHVQQTMRHVVISAAVDRHLSQSEDVYVKIHYMINVVFFNFDSDIQR